MVAAEALGNFETASVMPATPRRSPRASGASNRELIASEQYLWEPHNVLAAFNAASQGSPGRSAAVGHGLEK